jgi:PhnB protein
MTGETSDSPSRPPPAPPGYAPVASWVNHVEVDLAGTAVMLFDAGPSWPATPAHTRVYVTSVQAVLGRAEASGARIVTEPRELPFGDIVARFRDPQGHRWWIHEHVEDVGLAEMSRRFADGQYQQALRYVGDTLQEEMQRT